MHRPTGCRPPTPLHPPSPGPLPRVRPSNVSEPATNNPLLSEHSQASGGGGEEAPEQAYHWLISNVNGSISAANWFELGSSHCRSHPVPAQRETADFSVHGVSVPARRGYVAKLRRETTTPTYAQGKEPLRPAHVYTLHAGRCSLPGAVRLTIYIHRVGGRKDFFFNLALVVTHFSSVSQTQNPFLLGTAIEIN